jgi:hypothetical protein
MNVSDHRNPYQSRGLRPQPRLARRFKTLAIRTGISFYNSIGSIKSHPISLVDDDATNRRILEDSVIRWKMLPTVVEGAAAIPALHDAQVAGAPLPLVAVGVTSTTCDGTRRVTTCCSCYHNVPAA